ncbi:hypothetical protein FACS189434_06480 [Bacteroidia bacterium]|nr:hypothetical protein FACS189434_06480 [Bacteroidia bacterium]
MEDEVEEMILPSSNSNQDPYPLIRSGKKPLDYGGIYDVQNYDKQRDDTGLQQYDPTKDFEYRMIVDRYQPRRKYTPEQEERKKMFASFGDASIGLGELLASVAGGGRNVIRDRRGEVTHAEKTGAEIDAAREKYEKELLNYNNLLHSAGMRGRDKAEKDLAGQRGLKMELLLKELEGRKADEREKAQLAARERAESRADARFWASLEAKEKEPVINMVMTMRGTPELLQFKNKTDENNFYNAGFANIMNNRSLQVKAEKLAEDYNKINKYVLGENAKGNEIIKTFGNSAGLRNYIVTSLIDYPEVAMLYEKYSGQKLNTPQSMVYPNPDNDKEGIDQFGRRNIKKNGKWVIDNTAGTNKQSAPTNNSNKISVWK